MPFTIVLASEETDHQMLLDVKEVLESIPGKFFKYVIREGSKGSHMQIPQDELFYEEGVFFRYMNEFRRHQDINQDNFLIFLTSRNIPGNYFNGIDFGYKNIFVDINKWSDYYLKGSPDKYPISYHVILSVFIALAFKDKNAAKSALHSESRGCILDYNRKKQEVELKLLTARICPACMDIFLQNLNDINLLAYFRMALERIRHDIVEGEYYRKIRPKPVKVTLEKSPTKKTGVYLQFEGIGELNLDAAHMMVYVYFLVKNTGVYHQSVYEDYYFLLNLYKKFDVAKKENTIQKLCKLKKDNGSFKKIKSNALSERIALINKEITIFLGTFGLQLFYQILVRSNGKHGVDPNIIFEDKTGYIKELKGHLGKFKDEFKG